MPGGKEIVVKDEFDGELKLFGQCGAQISNIGYFYEDLAGDQKMPASKGFAELMHGAEMLINIYRGLIAFDVDRIQEVVNNFRIADEQN